MRHDSILQEQTAPPTFQPQVEALQTQISDTTSSREHRNQDTPAKLGIGSSIEARVLPLRI